MKTSNAAVIVAVNSMTALLNVGGACTVNIYTGAQPADVSVAPSGTLLGTVTASATAFAAATDAGGSAIAVANAITSGVGVGDGVAGYFRAFDGNGLAVLDGDAGQGSGELNLDNSTIATGNNINVISWNVSMAE